MRYLNLVLKRMIDLIGSFLGIFILFPFLVLTAVLIKRDSNGPVFFRQKRIGRDGIIYNIIKFRTMINDAEHTGDGLSIKDENDPRITHVGSFLRRTSIDELPQLMNVLLGEMSLVGPRPPLPNIPYEGYEEYPEWTKARFTMRPGITGLAQIEVRNSVVWDQRIEYDIQYVNDFNIFLDIKILLRTVKKIFRTEDIYEH